ncbi:MAG: dockerin type I repeat-containing protein [Prevotella sp.]|nr:dockerin type I repeat-containing protein [Prevotella sp.]
MKKLLAKICIIATMASWAPFLAMSSAAQSSMKGDVNGDGTITITDVAMMVNHILNSTEMDFIAANADLNGDGDINITDVIIVVDIILNNQGTIDPCLVVWHKDGSKIMFRLAEDPKFTYLGEIVIVQASTTVEYEFQAIRKVTFDLAARSSAILGLPFTNNGKAVTFMAADNDLSVKVYTTDDNLLKELVVRKGETATLTLDSHATNDYKMDVNGVTYKIKTK